MSPRSPRTGVRVLSLKEMGELRRNWHSQGLVVAQIHCGECNRVIATVRRVNGRDVLATAGDDSAKSPSAKGVVFWPAEMTFIHNVSRDLDLVIRCGNTSRRDVGGHGSFTLVAGVVVDAIAAAERVKKFPAKLRLERA